MRAAKRYLSDKELRFLAPKRPDSFFKWFLAFPWKNYRNDKDAMKAYVIRFIETGHSSKLLDDTEAVYLIQSFQQYYRDVLPTPGNRGHVFLEDIRYLIQGSEPTLVASANGRSEIEGLADRIFSECKVVVRSLDDLGADNHITANHGDVIHTSTTYADLLAKFYVLQTYDTNDTNATVIRDYLSGKWYLVATRDIDLAGGLRLAKIHTDCDYYEFVKSSVDENDTLTWTPWGLFDVLYKARIDQKHLPGRLAALQPFCDQFIDIT